ncbi:60S ribosomal protein L13 [Orbilia ellipsospora]|uniref:60S ribosomal protein L13 n=1 Tax=Orbilia ellipsospora TaxID=2528407 RepID=A0AAV9XFU3_9PEZI
MTLKHNQQLPNNHFRKHWQERVRVHFDQPGRKLRRRQARLSKASAVAPRPVDKLRPVVRCPTIKYNRRVRPGRGFTLEELKAAAIPRKLALTIGIPVDHRRQNRSEEGLTLNVQRLKEYHEKLILFPRRIGRPKTGDASKEDVAAARDAKSKPTTILFPIVPVDKSIQERAITSEEKEGSAYRTLRLARSNAKYVGIRAKRAKAKEEAEAASKK